MTPAHPACPRTRSWRDTLAHATAALGASLALAVPAVPAHAATSILFVGNSFTYGALASVQNYMPGSVTDLNGTNIGGVPALFKSFTRESGLNYAVSLETEPGSNLDFHYNNRLALINKPWDVVVMHGQSNLDFEAPGNPSKISTYTGILGSVFQARNPNVEIGLTATWSRADLTYRTASPWLGKPIDQMGKDIQAGYEFAAAHNPGIVDFISPVGLAWNRAILKGIADPNPYDGISPGQINLWAPENYHASNYGYYLHALVVFGEVTGLDPRTLGENETAARDLGFAPGVASALQQVAYETLAPVPEPSTWALMGLGACVVGVAARKRREGEARQEPASA